MIHDPRRRGGDQHIPRPDSWRPGSSAPWAAGDTDNSDSDSDSDNSDSDRDDSNERAERIGGRDVAGQLGDARLDALLRVVRVRQPVRLAPPFPGARNSAVLIVLHDGPDGAEALFTKRAQHLRNHKGEISFPGGRMEPGETAEQAAVREAWEEVALDPALVEVHGELDHLSTLVSNSYIVPVVATVSARPPLQPNAGEVDRILWVRFDELAHADTYREEWWGVGDVERPIHFFELEDETIWGATARMLHQLLRLAHGVDEPEPPVW